MASSSKAQSFEKIASGNETGTEKKIDEDSCKGRFGWADIERNYIPYLFRTANKEKYASVRMFEQRLLNRYLNALPSEVMSCISVNGFYITEAESRLLNDINLNHTNCLFGKATFNGKDLIVSLEDATAYYHFLALCHNRVVKKQCNPGDRCGFVRIGGESVVPFTLHQSKQYVPLFYFEEVTEHLQLNSSQIDGWDLAYLKFCCKVQGIRQTLFASDVCKVVALEQIKNYFPPGTSFEDYWPAKEPWSTTTKSVTSSSWIIKPSCEPNTANVQQNVKSSGDIIRSTRASQANNITPPASNTNIQQPNVKPQPNQKKSTNQEQLQNNSQAAQISMTPTQKREATNNNTERNKRLRS